MRLKVTVSDSEYIYMLSPSARRSKNEPNLEFFFYFFKKYKDMEILKLVLEITLRTSWDLYDAPLSEKV